MDRLQAVRAPPAIHEERSMKKLCIALVLAATVDSAYAGTLTLSPVVEGSVRDIPKDGIGDFSYIEPLRHGNFTAYMAEDRGIVEFDLRGLRPVRHARLVALEHYDTIGAPVGLSLFGYRADGMLSLTDFAAGTPLTAAAHRPGDGVNLDVTGFVNEAIALRYDFIGLNLRQDSITMAGIVEYQPSHLEITSASSVVPEPASAWLMGIAALALCRRRRRRPVYRAGHRQ